MSKYINATLHVGQYDKINNKRVHAAGDWAGFVSDQIRCSDLTCLL